jgi:hypothetical protein
MKGKLLLYLALALAGASQVWATSTVKISSRTFQNSGAGTDVVAAVNVSPADGVTAMDFAFTYDASLLSPTGVFRTGYANAFSITSNLATPGTVSIQMSGGGPLAGSGDVVWVLFHVTGAAGNTSPLNWVSAALNAGAIASTTQNGSVIIQAADVVISTPDTAQGAPGATVVVPISATSFTNGGAFDLVIKFNENVVSAVSVASTPLTSCLNLVTNLSVPGTINMVLFGSCTVSGSGPLVNVTFNVTGSIGSVTALNLTRGGVNDGVPTSVLDDGLFTVCDALDGDGDGFTGCGGDCNNSNPNVHPGAAEICNGLDDDCSPATPDGAAEPWVGAPCDGPDTDLCIEGNYICQGGAQFCTDQTGSSVESCNGLDDDCDGSIDEGVQTTYYRDQDNDGFGDSGQTSTGCAPPPGYVASLGDCNDNDPAIHPGASDANCNNIDENCSGAADEGYVPVGTSCGLGQCASTGATSCVGGAVHDSCAPGAPSPEVCDGLDNNCDGTTDNPAAPAGIPGLGLPTKTNLQWSSVSGATAYDVVRGTVLLLQSSLGNFTTSTDSCIADDAPGNATTDAALPATGDSYWYLVRPVNCGGAGTYNSGGPGQVASRDAGIAAAPGHCP